MVAKQPVGKASRRFIRVCFLLLAWVWIPLPSSAVFLNAQAAPVEVRYPEGVGAGFVTVSSLQGEKLGEGELSQVSAGADRVVSRLLIRFRDGSVHDETVLFSQKKTFKLLSYKLVQRGSSFPESVEISMEKETGTYTIQRGSSGAHPVVSSGQLDLPSDTYNGMAVTLLKNLEENAEATVHMIDFLPEPKVHTVQLMAVEKETFRAGGVSRRAVHYVLKPKLGWFMKKLAAVLGKTPPDYHFWLVKETVPVFLRYEGPLTTKGPSVRIEQASPRLAWIR